MGVGVEKKVLGNAWWEVKTDGLSKEQESALLLWLNSSLSMLLFFGRRVTTEGAWMQMKQPAWESMPVLNVRTLTEDQLKMLSSTFDAVSALDLLPLAQLDKDEVRIRIDETIAKVLGLPSLTPIKTLLVPQPA